MGIPHFTTTCPACHDHAVGFGRGREARVVSGHERLMTTQGTEVPIRLDNFSGKADRSFASATNPASGLCEVCHTTTLHYRADGTGAPHYTFSCAPCHTHAQGFAP